MNASEAVNAGMVRIGAWGMSVIDAGAIWCKPEDVAAVRAAYDATEESNPDLSDITAAGGVYIRD